MRIDVLMELQEGAPERERLEVFDPRFGSQVQLLGPVQCPVLIVAWRDGALAGSWIVVPVAFASSMSGKVLAMALMVNPVPFIGELEAAVEGYGGLMDDWCLVLVDLIVGQLPPNIVLGHPGVGDGPGDRYLPGGHGDVE